MPTMTLTQTLVMGLIQVVAVLILIFMLVPLTTFAERKVIGYIQVRLGATRIAGGQSESPAPSTAACGPWARCPVLSILRGLPVFIADILKLIIKEDIIPAKADERLHPGAHHLGHGRLRGLLRPSPSCPAPSSIFPAGFPIVGGLPFWGSFLI